MVYRYATVQQVTRKKLGSMAVVLPSQGQGRNRDLLSHWCLGEQNELAKFRERGFPYLSAADEGEGSNRPRPENPGFTRFSTVVGSRGPSDTVRDVRGFATEFYIEDGNYDLLGNNTPIFFIHDAIKFPDLDHTIKDFDLRQDPSVFEQVSCEREATWDAVMDLERGYNQPLTR